MQILAKGNLVGAKLAPTAILRAFTPLVKRIRFSSSRFASPTQNQTENRQTLQLGVESADLDVNLRC